MTRYLPLALLAALALPGAVPAATEKLPAGSKLTKLEVSPARITLDGRFAYSQLLVTGALAGGDKIDVTRMVAVEAPAKVVKVGATGQVRPLADGKGAIKLSLAGLKLEVPVEVKGQKDEPTVSFIQDVMPVLAR